MTTLTSNVPHGIKEEMRRTLPSVCATDVCTEVCPNRHIRGCSEDICARDTKVYDKFSSEPHETESAVQAHSNESSCSSTLFREESWTGQFPPLVFASTASAKRNMVMNVSNNKPGDTAGEVPDFVSSRVVGSSWPSRPRRRILSVRTLAGPRGSGPSPQWDGQL